MLAMLNSHVFFSSTGRFMQYDCGSVDDGKETARREIEDLRSGLSELNLPKEQDFRFR